MDRSLIQPRDPGTPARLLDLTDYFGSPVYELSYQESDSIMGCQDLRHLPRGQVTFNRVDFDVRGIIQLKLHDENGPLMAACWEDIPESVREIPVSQRFGRVHLLLGTYRNAPEGRAIGAVVLNYADGSRHECEILYGRHVRALQTYRDPRNTTDLAQVAWEGEDPCPDLSPTPTRVRVYQAAWDNPRPDEEVVSLDLVSKMTQSAPFVIGVTVE